MRKRIAAAGLALMAFAVGARTTHAEWVSVEELQASCDALLSGATDRNGSICRAFVHGYLLGSDRPASPQRPVKAPAASESWSDRALRTRVNPVLLQRVQSSGPSPYCIEEGTALDEVVRTIADHISAHPAAADVGNGAIVREALVRHFPCDA